MNDPTQNSIYHGMSIFEGCTKQMTVLIYVDSSKLMVDRINIHGYIK